MNLRFKAPLMVAAAAGAVFLTTGYACMRAQYDYIESMRRQKLSAVSSALKTGFEGQCRGASQQADMLANLGSVKEALRTGDRAALDAAVRPVYMLLTGRGTLEVAYFHDKDLKVFLNMKEPSRFGEDVSGRETVVRANRYRETQAGVQATPAGLGVRAVASIDSGTEHIGSFELGVNMTRMITRMKETTGAEIGVWVDERAIPREVAATGSGARAAAPEAEGTGMKLVVATNQDTLKAVITNEFLEGVTEDIYSTRTVVGVEYDIIGVPIFDFAGRQIGVAGGLRTVTESRAEVRTMFVTFLAGTAIGVVLLAGVVFLVFDRLLRRPLGELEKSIEIFARAEDLDTPLVHMGRPDEFGGASKSLNKLRDKLKTDAALKSEAETIVTTRRLKKLDKESTIEEPKAEAKPTDQKPA